MIFMQLLVVHFDEPFRRRQSAPLVRKCDLQARSFDGLNSVCGLRFRGARFGRRSRIVRNSGDTPEFLDFRGS
jgi:hypothetical protein